MEYFEIKNGEMYCEDVPLAKIAADVGTPAYVYSKATLRRHAQRLKQAFASYPTTFCFAVKANSNQAVLREIFGQGFGADIVSLGEFERALRAGAKASQIVFSGVGKQVYEIERAITEGVLSFNVESIFELQMIDEVAARLQKRARIALRVNPNIDAQSNPKITTGLYTSKFGIAEQDVDEFLRLIKQSRWLDLVGIACHIGSQILDLKPLAEAARNLARLASGLTKRGFALEYLNMGGGLGIRYADETPPELEAYAEALLAEIKQTKLPLILEPGRVLIGNTGVLLTRVVGVKQTPAKTFVIVDGAMNDLIRPSMYDSYHEIVAVTPHAGGAILADIVGPICETGDFFGKDRKLPPSRAGDLLMIRSCGAYGFSMASQYNSRPRPPEVFVDGKETKLIRRREELADLWKHEC